MNPVGTSPEGTPASRWVEGPYGQVSCNAGPAGWIVSFRPREASEAARSWVKKDAGEAGRLVGVLVQSDAALLVGFLRDMILGREDGLAFRERADELKRRRLVRQTRPGQALPTERGADLWAHAVRVVAREALEAPGPSRSADPFFIVFDAANRGRAFADGERARAAARRAMDERPEAFRDVSRAEDLVECWTSDRLGPGTAEKVEAEGEALLP